MIEYVNVPVPKDLVPNVMGLILAASQQAQTVAKAEWSQADAERVVAQSDKRMKTTLKLLASKPGMPVTGSQIATALNLQKKGHSVAGMFGAFGRRLKGRHKGLSAPFTKAWNVSTREWEYTMSAPVAKLFRAYTG